MCIENTMIRLRPPHSSSNSSHHSTGTSTGSSNHNGTSHSAVPVPVVAAVTVEEGHGNHIHNHHNHPTTIISKVKSPRQKQYPKQSLLLHRLYQLLLRLIPHRILHLLYRRHHHHSSILCGVISIVTITLLIRYSFHKNMNDESIIKALPSFLSHNLRFSRSTKNRPVVTSSIPEVTLDMKEYLQQPNNRLRPIDYQYFTIRINTWERIDQLQLSIQHHLSCTSVLQVQIVWCIDQSIALPDWLIQLEQTIEPIVLVDTNISYPRIVIERHTINSLNERFHPLVVVPTAAVLSIDDDVIRPCLALDATFSIWLRNPDRQVGFDARSHEVVHSTDTSSTTHHRHDHHHDTHHDHHNNLSPTSSSQQQLQETEREPQWKYSYMSVTEKKNSYSLTLTRYSFFHQYYMTLYMNHMPSVIRTTIDQNFNCEDIAMSMYISACHSQHKVPLLANVWAVKSQIKMYVAKKISGTNNHKQIRDDCVHHFSQLLHLQDRHQFHTVPLRLGTLFEYGDTPENWNDLQLPELSTTIQDAMATIERWKHTDDEQHIWMEELKQHREDAIRPIYDAGYIEKTIPWQRKFSMHPK
jgi:glucuronyl/N-acetylglucosaminyl transferase EXT2